MGKRRLLAMGEGGSFFCAVLSHVASVVKRKGTDRAVSPCLATIARMFARVKGTRGESPCTACPPTKRLPPGRHRAPAARACARASPGDIRIADSSLRRVRGPGLRLRERIRINQDGLPHGLSPLEVLPEGTTPSLTLVLCYHNGVSIDELYEKDNTADEINKLSNRIRELPAT